jgi:PTS system mannose-specific IIA component
MSVGVLLVTHGRIGHELLAAAGCILGSRPSDVLALGVPSDGDPDELAAEARTSARQLDAGDGVLVLTDLFGSTPCNIAASLCDGLRNRVLSGVSLPMLLRVLNYRQLPLDELVTKATSGAHDGVVSCAGPGRTLGQDTDAHSAGSEVIKPPGSPSVTGPVNRPANRPDRLSSGSSARPSAEPLVRSAPKTRVRG